MSNTIQLTNTYGIVNIGTPNGLKNSLNAEPIGIVIIIATNTITTLYHGNEIGIRLKQPIDLQYGDILYKDDTNMIIVDVNSEDLLVIKPRTLQEMGDIAHQLGNRHLPAQFTETEMLVQYDYLVESLLKDLGIPYEHEDRKVNKAFRHIGHSHD